MDKTNMSEEERQLCREINETGIQKFRRELQKLADLAQVSIDMENSHYAKLQQRLFEICVWLDNARCTRQTQLEQARVRVSVKIDNHEDSNRISVKDGDDDDYDLIWHYYAYQDRRVSLPAEPKRDAWPANCAMECVTFALNQLRRLQSLVIKYMKLKNEIDDLEHEESIDRVAKFRHQLELLKKL